MNEHGRFLYSKRRKKRSDEERGDRDAEENIEGSAEGSQVFVVKQPRITSDSYEEALEEHQITDTDLLDMNRSRFLVNKYRNGTTSWVLRITGLFLCALGMFVTGLGLVEAVYGLLDVL